MTFVIVDTVSPITTWATLPGAPAEWTVHVSNDTERGQGDHGANFRKYSNEQIETRMDAAEASGHIRYRFPRPASAPDKDGNKIMGLVAVRNVAENIGLFLQLLVNFFKFFLGIMQNKKNMNVRKQMILIFINY